MAKLPISRENLDFVRLDLSRHYIQIDCDFTCYLVLNPSGSVPLDGTDICVFRIGAWQIDAWVLLTDKFTKNTPGFSACLCWDKSLVTELSKAPRVAESDIDTANSISSLKGQPVNITGFSLSEGDSLKVSTLESEWVNIKPFDEHVEFPMFVKSINFAVGEQIPDYLPAFLNIKKIEGGVIHIDPAVYNAFGDNSAVTSSKISLNTLSVNRGQFWFSRILPSNQSEGANGSISVDDFTIEVNSENVVTKIGLEFAFGGIGSSSGSTVSIYGFGGSSGYHLYPLKLKVFGN